MAVYKCKMCGAALEVTGNASVITCEYCETAQTIPTVKDENLQGLFNRANTLRIKCEFDKAEQLYEKVIQADPSQAEAYWGMILCRYGIEYVEDPKTYKRVPTCHRASFESVIADEDYKSAMNNADSIQRILYENEAREIDRIQKEILEISKNEEPYDVFICYKETDESGKRTQDSVIANDIYYQLTQEGFKVFYAAITLEDKLGSAYEPCIFAALNSAKVMLSIGTKPEYFGAVWVKNEWSRFMKIMKKDRSKMLVPCYRDMDAYDLPEEFAHLQAQDMSKLGFIPDLVRNIKKIIVKEEAAPTVTYAQTPAATAATGDIAPLLERASMYLEDGNFESADIYCEKVLDKDPKNAKAYLYKVLASLKLANAEKLSYVKGAAEISAQGGSAKIRSIPADNKVAVIKTLRSATGWSLANVTNFVNNPNTAQSFNLTKEQAQELKNAGVSFDYAEVKTGANATIASVEENVNYKKFLRFASETEIEEVNGYVERAKNSTIYAAKRNKYNDALNEMSRAKTFNDYISVAVKFETLGDFEQAQSKASESREKAEISRKEYIYTTAKSSLTTGDPDRLMTAYEDLESIISYKDSAQIRESIPELIKKANEDIRERQRNSDYEYALRISNNQNVEDLSKAINILKNLGEYKNSPGMVNILTAKLKDMEECMLDKALRDKLYGDYIKEYPSVLKRGEYQNKINEETTRITSNINSRRGIKPGCAPWVCLMIGLCLTIVCLAEFEEEIIVFALGGLVLLGFALKGLLGALISRMPYSANIRRSKKAKAKYEKEIESITKLPSFETYYQNKRKTLTSSEIELAKAAYNNKR